MLEQLDVYLPDPILGLAAECRADPNPNKIDLTVGIYMDEAGVCPVFQAVREAQQQLWQMRLLRPTSPLREMLFICRR